METWNGGPPFRETLRARAAAAGVDPRRGAAGRDLRPERYVANLGPLFDRLAALTGDRTSRLVARGKVREIYDAG